MRLLCISDTHGKHRELDFAGVEADVIIHCGDFTNHGRMHEVRDFVDWFESLPFRKKILVAGNHDVSLDPKWQEGSDGTSTNPALRAVIESCDAAMNTLIRHNPNIEYLENSGVTIDGIEFYGAPLSRGYGVWAFETNSDEKAMEVWSKVPASTHVLITHSPPYGYCDVNQNGQSVGCAVLKKEVERIEPVLHVFGHVHMNYDSFPLFDDRYFANCAVVDGDLNLRYSGMLFSINTACVFKPIRLLTMDARKLAKGGSEGAGAQTPNANQAEQEEGNSKAK